MIFTIPIILVNTPGPPSTGLGTYSILLCKSLNYRRIAISEEMLSKLLKKNSSITYMAIESLGSSSSNKLIKNELVIGLSAKSWRRRIQLTEYPLPNESVWSPFPLASGDQSAEIGCNFGFFFRELASSFFRKPSFPSRISDSNFFLFFFSFNISKQKQTKK